MQFIESSDLYVRAVIYRLSKDGYQLEYLLCPMIHIGSPQYYDEVLQRLMECDLIFVEGVHSKKISFLRQSMRFVGRSKRLGLMHQSDADLARINDRTQHADMDVSEFDSHWSAMSLAAKFILTILAPCFFVYFAMFGSRRLVGKVLAFDDLPSRREIVQDNEHFDEIDNLLKEKRDKNLIRIIETHFQENQDEKLLIGVMYGARHMRAVVRFLMNRLGYKITASDWVKVFDL